MQNNCMRVQTHLHAGDTAPSPAGERCDDYGDTHCQVRNVLTGQNEGECLGGGFLGFNRAGKRCRQALIAAGWDPHRGPYGCFKC